MARQILAGEGDSAAIRHQPRNGVEQAGLARAVQPYDRDELSLSHPNGDIFQRLRGDAFDRPIRAPARPGDWTWLAAACTCGEEYVTQTDEYDGESWTYHSPATTFGFNGDEEANLTPAPAMIYRELVANPFVSLEWNPGWFTSTVRDLATHIYTAREFTAMPILADALQVGDAFTIFSAEDLDHVRAIERFIGASIPRLKLENFDYLYTAIFNEAAIPSGGGARGGRTLKGYSFGATKKRR